jgi:hypothetical protein
MLFLQLKNSKFNEVGNSTAKKPLPSSDFVYKAVKFSAVFALAFSWHVMSEIGCDMVSCSWSQIGSPVRLDLEPELIHTESLELLKVADFKPLLEQV